MTQFRQPSETILFFAASLEGADPIRTHAELREMQASLQRSTDRGRFTLQVGLAARPQDVTALLARYRPSLVHFAAHGDPSRLALESGYGFPHLLDPETVAGLIQPFAESVRCIVFNTCFGAVHAEALAPLVQHVIATEQHLGDRAAIVFAKGFYQALDGGMLVPEAYRVGCALVRAELGTAEPVPQLRSGAGDPYPPAWVDQTPPDPDPQALQTIHAERLSAPEMEFVANEEDGQAQPAGGRVRQTITAGKVKASKTLSFVANRRQKCQD